MTSLTHRRNLHRQCNAVSAARLPIEASVTIKVVGYEARTARVNENLQHLTACMLARLCERRRARWREIGCQLARRAGACACMASADDALKELHHRAHGGSRSRQKHH